MAAPLSNGKALPPRSRRWTAALALVIALVLTGGLSWQAWRNYQAAAPMAAENLRGLALTTATILEGGAANGSSLQALGPFLGPEIAYAAIVSSEGRVLFHTNEDLIDSAATDRRYQSVVDTGRLTEERVRLGTGERVYEFQTPFHWPTGKGVLRLALHTWRADEVLRQAALSLTVVFSLLAVGWGLGLTVWWLLRRQAAVERQAARQLELARLGEVGAVLAHEVRNPLAGIKGYGQLLEERLPPGRERDSASRIVGEAKRLEQLVDNILRYTRAPAVTSASCSPALVADEVLDWLAPQAASCQAHIRCTIAPGLQVSCPAEGLRQVLLNLVTNALQAGAEGGLEIVLEGQPQGDMLEIRVTDNGPGIAPEMRPGLFEPFRTSKARGAGLGLAVCQKILADCGGDIELEAGPAPGASFLIHLPLSRG